MKPSTKSNSAFTLVELLTTVAIVVVLMGMVLAGSRYVYKKMLVSQTVAEIHAIEAALEAYKADNGAYPPIDAAAWDNMDTNFTFPVSPTNGGWSNIVFVYKALYPTNTFSGGINRGMGGKVYMNFSQDQIRYHFAFGQRIFPFISDPNGKPYGYNPKTPIANPLTFDLFSAGSDGFPLYTNALTVLYSSTNDDIGNWGR